MLEDILEQIPALRAYSRALCRNYTEAEDLVLGRHRALRPRVAGPLVGDEGEALVVRRDDGSLLVDGGLPVHELRELIGSRLPDEGDADYHTAAGMLIAQCGRIPHVGEHFDWAGWRIEVVDLDGPRIDKLLLQRMEAVNGEDIDD